MLPPRARRRPPGWIAAALLVLAACGGTGTPSAAPELLAPAAAAAEPTATTVAATTTTLPAPTAVPADPQLCAAADAVERAGSELTAAAEVLEPDLTSTDPAGFLAGFRAADTTQLAHAAGRLEGAWRDLGAALPGDDAVAVADWLGALAAATGRARWPAEVVGPWRASADRAIPAAWSSSSAVAAACGTRLPIPPGLPGGEPVPLLDALDGPPGFVAPPLDVTTATYDVEQTSQPHGVYVHQGTEWSAPDRVRAEVEWTLSSEEHAVEEVVAAGGEARARWAGQDWRDVTGAEELSLAPVRADRTVPFGDLFDALYTAANAAAPEERHVRGTPALRYELEVGQDLERALVGSLVPRRARFTTRIGGAELWIETAGGMPRRAAVSLFTADYPEGLVLTWEFRSFEAPGPIPLPPEGEPAPAGYAVYRDAPNGWQAAIPQGWVPLEPSEPGLARFALPTGTVEVFPDDYVWDGALAGYEEMLVELFGEPVDRDVSATQLGPLPADRLDLGFDGAAGPERFTVVRGDDGEDAYWVVMIALVDAPSLDAELAGLLAGFELIGTAT